MCLTRSCGRRGRTRPTRLQSGMPRFTRSSQADGASNRPLALYADLLAVAQPGRTLVCQVERDVDELWADAKQRQELLNQDLFDEFCQEFTREMNRLRMERSASLSSAKREVERISTRIKKLLNLVLDDEIAVDEGRPRLRRSTLAGRNWQAQLESLTSRRHSCSPRWPPCPARRRRRSLTPSRPQKRARRRRRRSEAHRRPHTDPQGGRSQNRIERQPGGNARRDRTKQKAAGNRRPFAACIAGCGGVQPAGTCNCGAARRRGFRH